MTIRKSKTNRIKNYETPKKKKEVQRNDWKVDAKEETDVKKEQFRY